MKTILATAYAINPYKGSEDGMGWNFVCQIARFNRVIAITRENNRPAIEKYLSEHLHPDHERITFLYYDLPYWMRFWKKGSRGALLYYWMWQYGITRFIRRQGLAFDIAHNVNFHNDWTPSYLWKLNKPFVWGPVGHHPQIPHKLLGSFSAWFSLKEKMTWWVKRYFWELSPSLRHTVRRADHILCMNSAARRVLKVNGQQSSIMPSVASEDFGRANAADGLGFRLLSAGRLVPLKGFDLSIEAFAQFVGSLSADDARKCELVIVGSGPERKRYEALAWRHDVGGRVRFVEWLPRPALISLYGEASAFLFPSHEGAGMVVSEALSFGLPVICLNNSGPGEFITPACGLAITPGSRDETINALAGAIGLLYQDHALRQRMGAAARQRYETTFHWNRRGEALRLIYEKL